jgi:hypothetical protein
MRLNLEGSVSVLLEDEAILSSSASVRLSSAVTPFLPPKSLPFPFLLLILVLGSVLSSRILVVGMASKTRHRITNHRNDTSDNSKEICHARFPELVERQTDISNRRTSYLKIRHNDNMMQDSNILENMH